MSGTFRTDTPFVIFQIYNAQTSLFLFLASSPPYVSFPPWNLLGFDLCTDLSILNRLDFVLVSILRKCKVFYPFALWIFICR